MSGLIKLVKRHCRRSDGILDVCKRNGSSDAENYGRRHRRLTYIRPLSAERFQADGCSLCKLYATANVCVTQVEVTGAVLHFLVFRMDEFMCACGPL